MRKWMNIVSAATCAVVTIYAARAQDVTPLANTSDLSGLTNSTGASAPTGSTPDNAAQTAQQLTDAAAVLNAKAAYVTALTAQKTANANAASVSLAPLSSNANVGTGTVTAGTGAGKIEGTLLASRALRVATDQLAARLCASALRDAKNAKCRADYDNPRAALPAPFDQRLALALAPCDRFKQYADSFTPQQGAIVIEANSAQMGFDAYDLLNIRLNSIGRQLCTAIADAHTADTQTAATPIPAAKGAAAGFLPAVAAGLDIVQKLIATDYNAQEIDITPDDQLMEKELIRSILARNLNWPVYAPDLHPVVDVTNNPVVGKIATLDDLSNQASNTARTQTETASKYGAGTSAGLDEATKTRIAAAAAVHTDAAKELTDAVTAYNTLLTTFTGGDATKPNPLTIAIKEGQTVAVVRSGGWVVVAKMDAMGVSTYTKKNFFTAFGAMPFFTSGGVLVSYTLVDGRSGQILDSLSVPVAGGYERVSDVHKGKL